MVMGKLERHERLCEMLHEIYAKKKRPGPVILSEAKDFSRIEGQMRRFFASLRMTKRAQYDKKGYTMARDKGL
jgi:hypothetical protein